MEAKTKPRRNQDQIMRWRADNTWFMMTPLAFDGSAGRGR